MQRNEIIEMARQAAAVNGTIISVGFDGEFLEAFAKLVAAKAIAKDREEFDIDELCARQNKIGYKQGYRAGQIAEREACAKFCETQRNNIPATGEEFSAAIRERGGATSRGEV